jgi:hypothetical protein
MNWNAFSDSLGLVSGVLLLVPSWKANDLLKEIKDLKTLATSATSNFSKDTAKQLLERFAAAPLSWDKWDDACLRGGAACLAASFLVKLVFT